MLYACAWQLTVDHIAQLYLKYQPYTTAQSDKPVAIDSLSIYLHALDIHGLQHVSKKKFISQAEVYGSSIPGSPGRGAQ